MACSEYKSIDANAASSCRLRSGKKFEKRRVVESTSKSEFCALRDGLEKASKGVRWRLRNYGTQTKFHRPYVSWIFTTILLKGNTYKSRFQILEFTYFQVSINISSFFFSVDFLQRKSLMLKLSGHQVHLNRQRTEKHHIKFKGKRKRQVINGRDSGLGILCPTAYLSKSPASNKTTAS